MKKILLLLAIIFVLPSYSQDKRSDIYAQHEVSIDVAKSRAFSFLQNKTSFRAANAADASFYQLAYTAQVDNNVCYYVFNMGNNEGYVIVSADDRTSHQILGYSTQGSFDYDKLPASAKAWINGYAKDVAKTKATGQAQTPTRITASVPSSVAPLLGDIAWNQFAPFNNLCPEVDGEKCPTGCVATAMAQLMYYHRWPEVGHGSHSYDWHGQTLSADFNHEYHWNLLKPYYTGDINVDGVEASEEVAILMRDCGYSLDMDYWPGGSGAAGIAQRLVDYFDYDKDIHTLNLSSTTKEHYLNVICEEISKGRPVNVDGGSEGGAHNFIFDGYDENGFVHINFGWGGFDNAYYAIDNTGFDASPTIYYGFRKNEGNSAGFDLISNDDFYVNNDGNVIMCDLRITHTVYGDDYGYSDVKAALAYENQNTHDIQYVIFSEENDRVDWTVEWINLLTPTNLTDGIYHLYPVMSVDGSAWLRFTEPAKKQNFITVTVTDGEISFSNEELYDEVEPGRVDVDGIYYILNEDNTATVTWKNTNKASYSGNVVIPETFSYNGTEYTVTKIGSCAFEYSMELEKVEIPASVTEIEFGGLSITGAKKIIFAPGSQLKRIGGWGFNGFRGEEIILPDGLEEIESNAFQGSGLKSIDLPGSINFISMHVFSGAMNLTDVTIHWNVPLYVPDIIEVFYDCPITNLYVPIGTKQKYAEAETWMHFANIIESEDVASYTKFYQITYLVDDQVYKTDNVEVGDIILLPDAPELDGYTFYRWEGLPEDMIMPEHDLTVTAVYALRGDVNFDQRVNITDAVDIVNDRLGYESANFVYVLSDVNRDEMYTVTDAIGVINIIYGEPVSYAPRRMDAPYESLDLSQMNNNTIALSMNCANGYTAFQFDVELPEGIMLDGISLNENRCKDFAVRFNKVDNNIYKVVAYNLANEPLIIGCDNLLTLNLSGANESGEVRLTNIHFSTQKAVDVMFDDLALSMTDGIQLHAVSGDNVEYNIAGMRVNKDYKGIVIVNGKKVIRK